MFQRKLLTVAATMCLFLIGCDGSLTVSGTLEGPDDAQEELCEIVLWSNHGPFWKKATPTVRRRASINTDFSVHWTIGGPAAPHWIEISCPGYEVYKGEAFEAPSSIRERKLGRIRMLLKEP